MPSDVFWAAFGGGAAAGAVPLIGIGVIEWIRWKLDRRLLELDFKLEEEDPNDVVFHLKAANPHMRTVRVDEGGFLCKDPDRPIWIRHGGIDAGEAFIYPFRVFELIGALRAQGRQPSDLKWVYFKPSVGRGFRRKIDKPTIRPIRIARGGTLSRAT